VSRRSAPQVLLRAGEHVRSIGWYGVTQESRMLCSALLLIGQQNTIKCANARRVWEPGKIPSHNGRHCTQFCSILRLRAAFASGIHSILRAAISSAAIAPSCFLIHFFGSVMTDTFNAAHARQLAYHSTQYITAR
jgi:hypothetical protein